MDIILIHSPSIFLGKQKYNMKARDYIEIHGFIACAMGACLIYNTLASCNQGRIKQIKGGFRGIIPSKFSTENYLNKSPRRECRNVSLSRQRPQSRECGVLKLDWKQDKQEGKPS